ncbi:MAG: hypothetical protein Q9212_004221 [Teloschistes hypoglaucus]
MLILVGVGDEAIDEGVCSTATVAVLVLVSPSPVIVVVDKDPETVAVNEVDPTKLKGVVVVDVKLLDVDWTDMVNAAVADVVPVTLLDERPRLLAVITLLDGRVLLPPNPDVKATDELMALADDRLRLVSVTLTDMDDDVALIDAGLELDVVDTEVSMRLEDSVVAFGKWTEEPEVDVGLETEYEDETRELELLGWVLVVVEAVLRLAKRLEADADEELGAGVETPTLSALMMSAA